MNGKEMEPLSRTPVLPRAATAYVGVTALAALAVAAPLAPRLLMLSSLWPTFLVLAAGAALGSALIVPTQRNHGFDAATLFICAAVLILPPEFVALMGIARYAPDLVRRRHPWYMELFNLANYTLSALLAWVAAYGVRAELPGPVELRWAAAAVTACVVLVGANHVLLAVALKLARGVSLRESGLFSHGSMSVEVLLGSCGILLALAWRANPYLVPVALAPFMLINRSFSLLELLQRSEQRFRAVFESTAMGIRLTDTSGRVVDHNRAYGEMLGRDSEELIGTLMTDLAEDGDGNGRALFGELVGGRRDSYAVEEHYRRADGSELWAHLTASVVRDPDGNAELTIGMIHDVTDRKELENRLYQAQKMDAIGRLAGGVAHDFNNLLTVITAHTGFLLGSLDPRDETLRSDVEAIAQAADRAATLTRQLLAFGRKQIMQPRVLDLNSIVVDTHRMLCRLIGADIHVTTVLDPRLALVKADPGQIEQVLLNLALNARDAMSDGGTLTLSTANTDGPEPAVALSVTDTGCGMDAATQPRIFEPFFTTKDAKGTGLGLASVYGIVAQSGGTIDVESAVGAGTTMTILLPAVADADYEEDDGPRTCASTRGGETVLLVEDEDGVRTSARRILAASGYTVLEAFDGCEALEIDRRHRGRIDLVLTDVTMPRMGGRELVAELALRRPDLKVLFMSGHIHDTDLVPGVTGVDSRFVQKPFNSESLGAAVREMLDAEGPGLSVVERRTVGAHPHR